MPDIHVKFEEFNIEMKNCEFIPNPYLKKEQQTSDDDDDFDEEDEDEKDQDS